MNNQQSKIIWTDNKAGQSAYIKTDNNRAILVVNDIFVGSFDDSGKAIDYFYDEFNC